MSLNKICDTCKKEITNQNPESNRLGFSEWCLFHFTKRRDFCSEKCLKIFVETHFKKEETLQSDLELSIKIDKLITDRSNVSGILKIPFDVLNNNKTLKLADVEYSKAEDNLKLLTDFNNGEVVEIVYNDKKWARVSVIYIELALKVMRVWYDEKKLKRNDLRWLLGSVPDSPVIVYYDDIGVIIAPRVEKDGI